MRVITMGLRVCATTTSRSVCAIHIRQNETTRLTNTSGLVIDLMASSLFGWKESMRQSSPRQLYSVVIHCTVMAGSSPLRLDLHSPLPAPRPIAARFRGPLAVGALPPGTDLTSGRPGATEPGAH